MSYVDYKDLIAAAAGQRTDEWKKARNGRATSSEISVLFPQRSPEKKFAAKHEGFGQGAVTYIKHKAMELYVGEDISEELDTYAVRWGRILEPAALKFYQLMTGDDTIETRGFLPHGQYAGGSVDLLSRMVGVGEIKCPLNQVNHYDALVDVRDFDDLKKFNYKYWWQVQSLMYFTGVHSGVWISFDPRQLKASWTPNDPEGFSPEHAFENATEKEKKMAIHIVEGDFNPGVGEAIEEMLPRFAKLRDRFYQQLIAKFG